MKRVIISSIIILFFIFLGTIIGIYYAKGYRVDTSNPKNFFQGTGLLVLTSNPDGARVIIDGKLTTATNNTINLQPGRYKVRIEKDGYFPWEKTIEIKKETVSTAATVLFPTAPRLESITTNGALDPVLDDTGSLIAYSVSSSSAAKNGIYVLNMSAPAILTLGGASSQVANNINQDFAKAVLQFSPDGTQLLASTSGQLTTSTYLLSARSFNSTPQDVTSTLPQVLTEWDKQKILKNKKLIDSLPKKIRAVAREFFATPVISPEEDKILYTASKSAQIPILIQPRLPGTNSTPEKRNIEKGNTYVYDMKEDRNYLIAKHTDGATKQSFPTDNFLWHPDSSHLIFVKGSKVNIMEFDGGNVTTVYAGPFTNGYVFPWPDGSSIVILTNLNIPDAPNNLYRISLR